MYGNVTHCKIAAFETCAYVPSKLRIPFDLCKPVQGGVRERQGVFRLCELILTFMKYETFLITANGKWRVIENSVYYLGGEGQELINAVDAKHGLSDISAIS